MNFSARPSVEQISHPPPWAGAAAETDLLQSEAGHDPVRGQVPGQLARRYHWHSIAVVTITPQGSRARLRVERCFIGPVYVVAILIALTFWPCGIADEWGGMIRALLLQRSC